MPRSQLQDEPALEHIRELHDHIQSDDGWRRQRTLDKHFIDKYFDEAGIPADDTANRKRRRRVKPERLSTGETARIVDLIASFYSEWPRFGAQWLGEGSETATIGEKVGQGLNEAFDQLNPAVDPPWKHGVWQQVMLGRRTDLIVPGHDYYFDFPWKNEGESESEWAQRSAEWRRKAPLQVVWFNLPAESTFPPSLSMVDDEVLSTKKLTWLDLMDIFDEDEMPANTPSPADKERWKEEVTLGIYSNRAWLAYVILDAKTSPTTGAQPAGDHLLRSIEHKLERCAIRILPGMTTGRKEPGYYWRSVLYSSRDLLDKIDILGTRAATSAKFNAFPLMQEHLNPTNSDNQQGATAGIEEVAEGDVIPYQTEDRTEGRGREGMSPVFQPEHGNETRELFLWGLSRTAQQSGASESLEGQIVANTPAWSHNWAAEMSKNKLRPLTSAILTAGIDLAETLSRAVIAFDEPITLAKLDEEGQRRGSIQLVPQELRRYQPVLSGSYDAKLPINWRADADAGMNLMVLSKQHDIVLDPGWVLKMFMGINDPWEHYRRWLEWKFMLSEEVQAIQTKQIADRFEAQMAEDRGMDEQEFAGKEGQLSELARMLLRQNAQQVRGGGNGARVGVRPETVGANRAGSMFTAAPGGRQPDERAVT